MKEQRLKIIGRHTFTIRDVLTGAIKSKQVVENLVTTVGRSVLASLLAGDNTYSGELTHGALGSSTTTPTNADTQLGAEIVGARVAVISQIAVANESFSSFFFPDGDQIDYEEFANFIDGSLTINSGQIFSHVLISGSKAVNETLTIDSNYEINNA